MRDKFVATTICIDIDTVIIKKKGENRYLLTKKFIDDAYGKTTCDQEQEAYRQFCSTFEEDNLEKIPKDAVFKQSWLKAIDIDRTHRRVDELIELAQDQANQIILTGNCDPYSFQVVIDYFLKLDYTFDNSRGADNFQFSKDKQASIAVISSHLQAMTGTALYTAVLAMHPVIHHLILTSYTTRDSSYPNGSLSPTRPPSRSEHSASRMSNSSPSMSPPSFAPIANYFKFDSPTTGLEESTYVKDIIDFINDEYEDKDHTCDIHTIGPRDNFLQVISLSPCDLSSSP